MSTDLRNPWLVAAWPGMGHVGLRAATYLVDQLGADRVRELALADHFDVEKVEIKDGLLQRPELPRSTLFTWRNPSPEGPDLIIFVGEAQASNRGFDLCLEVVDAAIELGARRVCTFAAMAAPIDPRAESTVAGWATDASLLGELRDADIEVFAQGEVGGLNGVLLAAAAQRSLPGLGLMASFPFFAANLPNPKASRAALAAFDRLTQIDLDLAPLDEEVADVELKLVAALEALQREAARRGGAAELPRSLSELPESLSDDDDDDDDDGNESGGAFEGGLSPEALVQIEHLFEQAEIDRARALELKAELDRHGVFKSYEDRFLDLFSRGE